MEQLKRNNTVKVFIFSVKDAKKKNKTPMINPDINNKIYFLMYFKFDLSTIISTILFIVPSHNKTIIIQ